MANVKISQLPSLSTMTDLAQIPVVAGGTTYQITGSNLSSYFSASSAGSKIVNGTTEANIGVAGGNVNISVGGISNVAVFTQSGVIVSGVLTAPVLTTNNIRSDDSSFVNIEDGVNVTGAVVASGNVTGGNIISTGVVVTSTIQAASGNITIQPVYDAFGGTNSVIVRGGNTGFGDGGHVVIQSGAAPGAGGVAGNVTITASNGQSRGGNVSIQAGTGTTSSGNVVVTTAGGSWNFNTNGNLTAPGSFSAVGNVTGGNVLATAFYGDVGNVTYQQTTVYYVDPLRTANYTPTGTIIKPFANVTAAISAATAAGITDTNPAEVVLLNNITENITLKPGIYLTSLGTGTHGSPTITGSVTVSSSTGTLVTNHYSLSNLRITAPSGGHGVNFTGTAPQKLFMRDMWITASGTGTGDCIYMDNTDVTSTVQMDIAHLAHTGTGDVYCINVTKANCYVTDIETSGSTQVAAVQTGAVLTIDGSELDAVGDVVCETYGTGSLTITNSIINNTATNGNGIKINSAGSTVTLGNNLFNIPIGTGSAVYYNPAATLYGSTLAFATLAFIPGTNTTVDARLLPVPLTVAVGTIASPVFAGSITSTTTGTWTLTDNSASSLSIDTSGKTGLLKFITTNGAEGVSMSGFASVTGNVTAGNATIGTLTLSGNTISSTDSIITIDPAAAGNTGAVIIQGNLSVTGNVTYIDSNTITTNDLVINMANNAATAAAANGGGIGVGPVTGAYATITYNSTSNIWVVSNGASVTGNVTTGNVNAAGLSLSGNVVSALVSAANITTTANISGGNLIGTVVGNVTGTTVSVTGNITGGNLNAAGLSLSSNVVSALNVTSNIAGGNITTPGLISATGNITGGNIMGGANVNATTHTGTTVSVSANVTGGNLITGALTSTASLSVTGNTATITSANYSVGYLNIPQISFAANATAALVDSGKHYYTTSASNLALTLADNSAVSWPVGTALSIVNRGTANVTVAPAAGVSLYLAGNSSSANRVVTTYGMATVMNVAANVWMINGTVV